MKAFETSILKLLLSHLIEWDSHEVAEKDGSVMVAFKHITGKQPHRPIVIDEYFISGSLDCETGVLSLLKQIGKDKFKTYKLELGEIEWGDITEGPVL